MRTHFAAAVAAAIVAATALLSALAGPVHAQTIGSVGPDSFGYQANAVVSPFEDISSTGTGTGTPVLSDNDEDGFAQIDLGFDFPFYGQSYRQVYVTENGLMTLGSVSFDINNVDLTSASTADNLPTIAPLWDDWMTSDFVEADSVYYQVLGAPGSRRLIVQWNEVNGFIFAPSNVTFQAVLFEGTGQILFRYKDVDSGDFRSGGGNATVGIRDRDGHLNGRNVQWSQDLPSLSDGAAILFTAADSAPPVVAASSDPATLRDSNRIVLVTVSGRVTDAGSGVDPATGRFSVQDEYGWWEFEGPVTLGQDGAFSFRVPLLAWRQNNDRDGHTYAITVTARDRAGNSGSAQTVVTVTRDKGKGK